MKIDFHSLVSLQIELWQDDKFISTATGFYYKLNNRTAFVSNWHVFSGRNANTGQPIDDRGAIPNIMKHIYQVDRIGTVGHVSYRLYDEETALWFQHPIGQAVDIGCFLPRPLPFDIKLYLPTDENVPNKLHKAVGSDCYIVGFPIFYSVGVNFPIWKRASIASEYETGYDGKNCFIVDTLTSVGMSGSPVYLRQYGSALNEDGSFTTDTHPQTNFVGIYSGRMNSAKEGPLSLGFVWKRDLIDEMLLNPKLGTYKLIK